MLIQLLATLTQISEFGTLRGGDRFLLRWKLQLHMGSFFSRKFCFFWPLYYLFSSWFHLGMASVHFCLHRVQLTHLVCGDRNGDGGYGLRVCMCTPAHVLLFWLDRDKKLDGCTRLYFCAPSCLMLHLSLKRKILPQSTFLWGCLWFCWRSSQDRVNSRDYRPSIVLAIEPTGLFRSWTIAQKGNTTPQKEFCNQVSLGSASLSSPLWKIHNAHQNIKDSKSYSKETHLFQPILNLFNHETLLINTY